MPKPTQQTELKGKNSQSAKLIALMLFVVTFLDA